MATVDYHGVTCDQRDALLTALEYITREASNAAVTRAMAAMRAEAERDTYYGARYRTAIRELAETVAEVTR